MVTFFNISFVFISEFFVSILRMDKEKPTKKSPGVFSSLICFIELACLCQKYKLGFRNDGKL